MIGTPEQYRERMKGLKLKAFVGGEAINDGFFEVMKAAADIAGGLLITMPSERELVNPRNSALLRKYLKGRSDIATEDRMRMFKFLNHYVASPHAAQAWTEGRAPYHLRMALYHCTDLEEKKDMARALAFITAEQQAIQTALVTRLNGRAANSVQ